MPHIPSLVSPEDGLNEIAQAHLCRGGGRGVVEAAACFRQDLAEAAAGFLAMRWIIARHWLEFGAEDDGRLF